MNPIPPGDLAQSLALRRQTTATRQEVTALTAEIASGIATDTARHMRGQTSPLAAISAAIARIEAYQGSTAQAETRASAMQAALGRLNTVSADSASRLLLAAQTADSAGMAIATSAARSAFEDGINALNTRLEDRSLFSGTRLSEQSLPAPSALLALARQAIGLAASPADAASRLDQWLADPAGFRAAAFGGAEQPQRLPLADGADASLDVTAADPGLRSTLKGLILGALMSEPDHAPNLESRVALARLAGQALTSGSGERVELAARIGLSEQRIAEAKARNAAESLSFQQARSDLVGIDSYEAATRLEDAQGRLSMIYAMTARLSELSLAAYLR